MTSLFDSAWLALVGLLSTAPAPGRVTIELATLHVAALTTSRSAADSTDAPYFLVSVLSPHRQASARLPASGQWRLAKNAVVAPTPIEILDLAPGDSARVVISVLEAESGELGPEADAAKASTVGLAGLPQPLLDPAGPALAPALEGLTTAGAHWMGSVSLLLTNEGGKTYWRRMECAWDCAVLQGLPSRGGAELMGPVNGVFELTGARGTYHMQLSLKAAN